MKTVCLRKGLIICFWLVIWQIASLFIQNSIIFVGPAEMAKALASLIFTMEFWKSITYTFCKISIGFLTAFLLGIMTGGAAYRFSFFKDMLEPVIILMKSIPVASFVILALIWTGSENLSIFISFSVAYPIIYINTLSGLQSADLKLLEMADVFCIPGYKRLLHIYRPVLLPYLISGCNIALGMSWKSGIAAEVIGVPVHSIGEKLYMAKIYLSTADLFAWTFIIIIISALFEKIFLALLRNLEY